MFTKSDVKQCNSSPILNSNGNYNTSEMNQLLKTQLLQRTKELNDSVIFTHIYADGIIDAGGFGGNR